MGFAILIAESQIYSLWSLPQVSFEVIWLMYRHHQ